jgi:hypothetical protein
VNREELSEAIHDLADSPNMRQYVIEHAIARLDLHQLVELFEQVADHHAMLHPPARRRVPRNPCLGDGRCTNPRCGRHGNSSEFSWLEQLPDPK